MTSFNRLSPIAAFLIVIRCVWLVTLLAVRAYCQDRESVAARVDEFVRGEMLAQHIPGLCLAVSTNGTIDLVKGYGLANVEHQVPVKPETVFQSGYVGKQFTATAIMMLVEKGQISLEDPISKHLPNVPE